MRYCRLVALAAIFPLCFSAPAAARFLQTDPVGYAVDVNPYTYVGNDPVNHADPKGLWTCGSGSETQCNVMEKSLAAAKSALPDMPRNERKVVQRILAVMGNRGDKNHIEVRAGTPVRGMSSTSTKDGETTILMAHGLTSTGAVERSAQTSAAGWSVHEGSHAVDQQGTFHGMPRNPQEYFDTERRAFTAQSYVERALNYHDTGPYPLDTNPVQSDGWTAVTNWAWSEAGHPGVKPW